MKETKDPLIDSYVKAFSGRDGRIEGEGEVFRCLAVARPKGENSLKVFTRLSTTSPDDPNIITFPAEFQGAPVKYVRPMRRAGHLTLVD